MGQTHPRSKTDRDTAEAAARARSALPTTQSRLTPEQLAVYLEHLSRTGDVGLASRLAGTTPTAIRERLKQDQEFADASQAAWQDYKDCVLIPAAQRRAVDGVEEGVYYKGEQGRNDDGTPAVKRSYSDALLIRLLERHDAAFRPHQVQEIRPGIGPQDLENLSPEAQRRLELLLEQVELDRAKQEEAKRLAAPPQPEPLRLVAPETEPPREIKLEQEPKQQASG